MCNNSLITCNTNLISVDISNLEGPFTLEFVTNGGIVAEVKAGHDGERLSIAVKDGLVTQKARTGTHLYFQIPKEEAA